MKKMYYTITRIISVRVNKYLFKVEKTTKFIKGIVDIRQNGSTFIEQIENSKYKFGDYNIPINYI